MVYEDAPEKGIADATLYDYSFTKTGSGSSGQRQIKEDGTFTLTLIGYFEIVVFEIQAFCKLLR
jgi:hypothetical protein